MELDSGTTQLIPLPEFSPRYASALHTRRSIGFRRFGIFEEDLRADFAARNRAALATHLLNICTIDPDRVLPENFFRDLSIGKRIECLIVLALGGADNALRFPIKCGGCGEEIELELTLDEIAALQGEADAIEIVAVDLGGRRIELEKLSGGLQENLSDAAFDNELDAASEIIARLALDPDAVENIGPQDVEIIEAAMDEADPLVNFTCRISCGECGQPGDHEIDLFETSLDIMRRTQHRLLVSVHRLASSYHWSEREIFAVPEWRRRQYLDLIGGRA